MRTKDVNTVPRANPLLTKSSEDVFDNVIIQTLLVIQRTQVALVYCYAFEDGYTVILVS
jgi:hypothetical protein